MTTTSQSFLRAYRFDYPTAESRFRTCINLVKQLTPNDTQTLASLYKNLGRSRERQANYTGAYDAYYQAIQLSPNTPNYQDCLTTLVTALSPEALKTIGNECLQNKHYKTARHAYTHAITKDPNFYIAIANRGRVWLEEERYEEAIQDYTEALRIQPEYVKAYVNRGVAYEKTGQLNLAISDYEKALELEPGNGIARQRLQTIRG